jgi:hypothetical protein
MTIDQYISLAIALATACGLLVAAYQLREGRRAQHEAFSSTMRVQREAFARGMWSDYLKLALANPELGSSDAAVEHLGDVDSYKDLALGAGIGGQRYLWFLTIVLDTCSAVLSYLPGEDWTATARSQLAFHKGVLRLNWKPNPYDEAWEDSYDAKLREIVEAVIAAEG